MGQTKDGHAGVRKVIQGIVFAIFALAAAGAVLALHSLVGGGLFGYGARIVMSSSMEENPNVSVDGETIKSIPVRSLIVIELMPDREDERQAFYQELQVGDVLTFSYRAVGENIIITHRVQEIGRSGKGYRIALRGDSGNFAGTQVIDTADFESQNRIIGKVVYCSHALGVFLCFLREPPFFITVCIAIVAVILLNIFRKGHLRSSKTLL